MAKQKNKFLKPLLLVGAIIIAVILLKIALIPHPTTTNNSQNPYPSVTLQTELLIDAAVWYPSAPWSEPKKSTQQTSYGNLSGESIHATVTSRTAYLDHFEMVNELKEKGFTPDQSVTADGPGSSMWGYVNEQGSKKQIMLFSYKTSPSSNNPNEPLQFNCPCKITVEVFVSNPF